MNKIFNHLQIGSTVLTSKDRAWKHLQSVGASEDEGTVGTWVLKDFDASDVGELINSPMSLEFSCNGVNHYYIGASPNGPSFWNCYNFVFGFDTDNSAHKSVFYVNNNGVLGDNGWYDEKDKTIQVLKEPSERAKDWLNTHATKIS